MKHPQSILTFDKAVVDTLGLKQGFNPAIADFYEKVKPHVFFGQRARLENDPDFRQWLPYAIFSKTVNGTKYFLVYRRTKQVGEARLAGNASIGLGGHVDLKDAMIDDNSVLNLEATIEQSSHREYFEELRFKDLSGLVMGEDREFVMIDDMEPAKAIRLAGHMVANTRSLGYIVDDEGEWENGKPPVGLVHFGHVQEISLGEYYDAEIGEAELEMVGWMSAAQLQVSHLPFEPWSRILIDQYMSDPRSVWTNA